MIKEFEGRTEQEAVRKAAQELGLGETDFEVEVLDEGRGGLFFKKPVRIRVSVPDGESTGSFEEAFEQELNQLNGTGDEEDEEPDLDAETVEKVSTFTKQLAELMGYPASVQVRSIRGVKLTLDIESQDSSIIIGRKGRNLDAVQVVVNAYANQIDPRCKVILDCENYRVRHEKQIVRAAFRAAQQVKKTGRSVLLEPMNPFERRLVHTALNDVTGIETKSEGEGLIKQVRVLSTRGRR
ncbi:MAG: protein jag [Spirochaetales bacterium]|nr:protein jag [Spirochaetales bacterium]